jgi:pheromone shutdown-related protein TraB
MICRVGGREITLIGTAHVSRDSIDEVSKAIREEKPDMVCVELDQGRYDSIGNREHWEKLNVVKVFREGKGFLLIANLVLAGFQRRLGNELGVKPGEEMMAATDTARELGIPFSFCDREVQITLRRAWSRCGLWSKTKLMASLVSSALITEKLNREEIENLKKRSELDGMMNELAEYLPPVKETLIDERDRYMAAKIWTAGGSRIIAVLGAGHMAGVAAHLENIAGGGESCNVEDMDRIPPPSPIVRFLPWLIPVLIAGLIGYGTYRFGLKNSFSTLKFWLFWNGFLAAVGTTCALGHPLSILVSFVGAPIATINPIIGVGLFAGLTEATIRKPRVEDAASINEDIGSIRGIYRNRIIKALLVFLLSTVGSAIGNVVSISSIAGRFFK